MLCWLATLCALASSLTFLNSRPQSLPVITPLDLIIDSLVMHSVLIAHNAHSHHCSAPSMLKRGKCLVCVRSTLIYLGHRQLAIQKWLPALDQAISQKVGLGSWVLFRLSCLQVDHHSVAIPYPIRYCYLDMELEVSFAENQNEC